MEFLDPGTFYRRTSRQQKYSSLTQVEIAELVRYQLYEFNNAKSETLGRVLQSARPEPKMAFAGTDPGVGQSGTGQGRPQDHRCFLRG